MVGLIGLIASYLSNLSGGGGALLILPALLAMGVSPLAAIGTIKIGSLGLVAGSIASSKDKGVIRKDYIYPLLAIVAVASILGPRISLGLDESKVKLISSTFILLTASVALVSLRFDTRRREISRVSRFAGYGLYFVSTSILAGFGSGIGILSNYILIGLLGMSPIETVSTRRVVGLVGVPLQLLVFAIGTQLNWTLGISLLIGNAIGGYFGMNAAIKQGNMFIKKAMALTSIILVISLFI